MVRTFLIMAFVWSWMLSSIAISDPLIGTDLLGGMRPQEQTGPPPEQQCGSEAYWDASVGRCRRNVPLTVPPLKFLPPPPGVIVLRPSRVYGQAEACPARFMRAWKDLKGYVCYEQADSCPQGFIEESGLDGWRFCVDPKQPETIPALMAPPIAGIPFYEAMAILDRHQQELMQLPGVESVGLGAEGVQVGTSNPAVVPSQVEGLPIKIIPPLGPGKSLNHSLTTRIRPIHGGLAVGDPATVPGFGTLTTVGLSQGHPWLIFPTHLLQTCSSTSPCPPATTQFLNSCSHYGTATLVQPPQPASVTVGFAQRWDPVNGVSSSTDVAAAFLDNDLVEGNMSLHADRTLETFGGFSGTEGQPMVNQTVTWVSSVGPQHILSATVTAINQMAFISDACNGGSFTTRITQTVMQATNLSFTGGDSGSPMIDQSNRIIGMINWMTSANAFIGGGTPASVTRQVLGFDQWYGTQTSAFALKCN